MFVVGALGGRESAVEVDRRVMAHRLPEDRPAAGFEHPGHLCEGGV
jgi:hypothetical protein